MASPAAVSGYTSSTTSSATSEVAMSTSTSTASAETNNTTSGISPKLIKTLIAVSIALAAIIIIFWIWMCLRRSNGCTHTSSNNCRCSRARKCLDWIAFGSSRKDSEIEKGERDWGVLEGGRTRRYVLGNDVSRRILGEGYPGRQSPSIYSRASRRTLRLEESKSPLGERSPLSGRGDEESGFLAKGSEVTEVERVHRPSHARQDSGKTVLAELERHLGGKTPMTPDLERPLPPFLPEYRFGSMSPTPSSLRVIVADVQKATVVRGKEAAAIVAVGRKKKNQDSPLISPASGSIQDAGRELGDLPAFLMEGGGMYTEGVLVGDGEWEGERDLSLMEKEKGEREREREWEIREKRKAGKRKRLEGNGIGRERAGSEGKGLLGAEGEK